jgi:hypothetical protein
MKSQPGIVYEWDGGLREVVRQHHGGLSPGDVIERESTQSDPHAGLPELDVPGRGDLGDHCGEDFPAFACEDCGHPVYVGRTCRSPTCERCWAANVKETAIRAASKLENHRYNLYYDQPDDRDVRSQHIVASAPPSVMFDSENPIERALLSIQELLPQFLAEPDNRSFFVVYHPFRIKQEYRKDVYDHPGEQGQGEMMWSDVLSSDDWREYVTFEPHFHVFCNTRYFEKTISEKVEAESGWVFHRIEDADSISVENLEDLTKQITYCLSHAGVRTGDRDEKVTRYKGELHNTPTHPKGIERATAAFCEAAPKLLGVTFANTRSKACDADVPADDTDDLAHDHADGPHPDDDHDPAASEDTNFAKRTTDRVSPLVDEVTSNSKEKVVKSGSGSPIRDGRTPGSAPEESASEWGESRNSGFSAESSGWTARGAADLEASSDDRGDQEDVDTAEGQLGDDDDRPDDAHPQAATCGGDLVPISEAVDLLEDSEWCRNAPHVSGLRVAAREWKDWKRRWQGRDADVAPAPPYVEDLHID